VAVENRVDDELNLLVVNSVDEAPKVGDSVKEMENNWYYQDTMRNMVPRRDMEKSQPDCLEQSQHDILEKSKPDCLKQSQLDCLKQSQPGCLEQSQPDCLKQTVERKMCGEISIIKPTKECEMTDTRVMTYKFLTVSGTGPLYKYLRYEILNNVGAVTEVNVPHDDTMTMVILQFKSEMNLMILAVMEDRARSRITMTTVPAEMMPMVSTWLPSHTYH
jgi:hypothetical protein